MPGAKTTRSRTQFGWCGSEADLRRLLAVVEAGWDALPDSAVYDVPVTVTVEDTEGVSVSGTVEDALTDPHLNRSRVRQIRIEMYRQQSRVTILMEADAARVESSVSGAVSWATQLDAEIGRVLKGGSRWWHRARWAPIGWLFGITVTVTIFLALGSVLARTSLEDAEPPLVASLIVGLILGGIPVVSAFFVRRIPIAELVSSDSESRGRRYVELVISFAVLAVLVPVLIEVLI